MGERWPEGGSGEPGKGALYRVLGLGSGVYGLGARLHRVLYERGWKQPRRLPCRVISVGGLTVGGAAKTPMAAWLAARLHERGHGVALLSRGYGRQRSEPVTVVSDGTSLHADVERRGDEPLILAAHAPGVPVLVGRDRSMAGLRAINAFDVETVVLDDGFQHHRLARDLEIVTLDGPSGFGNGRVLPGGPLREPPSALALADAVGVIDGPLSPSHEIRVAQWAPAAFRFEASRRPWALRKLGQPSSIEPEFVAQKNVGLLSGIARPAGFRRTVEALGAHVVAERVFGDHHRFRPRDLADLAEEAPLWITTEKDAVKLSSGWLKGADVRVLCMGLAVAEPESLLRWIEETLNSRRPLPEQ
jgi:tetraacyldisaccharide 4'-kinase